MRKYAVGGLGLSGGGWDTWRIVVGFEAKGSAKQRERRWTRGLMAWGDGSGRLGNPRGV
jgi:hypothetical protein